MKHQLICGLLASARVAAAAGDLGRPHDGAYQALVLVGSEQAGLGQFSPGHVDLVFAFPRSGQTLAVGDPGQRGISGGHRAPAFRL
jgi:hypothetical protein